MQTFIKLKQQLLANTAELTEINKKLADARKIIPDLAKTLDVGQLYVMTKLLDTLGLKYKNSANRVAILESMIMSLAKNGKKSNDKKPGYKEELH